MRKRKSTGEMERERGRKGSRREGEGEGGMDRDVRGEQIFF